MILRSAFLALTIRLPSPTSSFHKFILPKRLNAALFTAPHSLTVRTMTSSSTSASLSGDVSCLKMFPSRKEAEQKVVQDTLAFDGTRVPSGSLACQHDRYVLCRSIKISQWVVLDVLNKLAQTLY